MASSIPPRQPVRARGFTLARGLGWVSGAVGTLALATLVSRLFGFGRWLAQSAFVGSGAIAGAYASANQIPNIIFEIVIGGALTGLTVPLLAGAVRREDKRELARIASALLTWVLTILLLVAVGIFFAAPLIATALPVPVNADASSQHALISGFLRVFAWQIPLYGACLVLTGILQAHERFLLPALGPLFGSITVITTFALYAGVGFSGEAGAALSILAWGTTAGVAAMTLPLLVPVHRLGVKLRPTWYLAPALRRRALRLGASGLGALLAQQLSVVTSLWLMRRWGEAGTVAVFQYVQAVYWLPYAILAYPLATAAFPKLSQLGEDGAGPGFQHTCAWATRRVVAAGVIGCALLVAVAPLAQAFFMLLTPVPGMERALVIIAPALLGYSLLYHGQRVLYAVMATRAAWQVGVAAWGSVTVASVAATLALAGTDSGAEWFALEWGAGEQTLAAIAGGQTVGMMVAAAGVLFAIRRQVGERGLRRVGRNLGRLFLALVPVTALAWGINHWLVSAPTGGGERILQCLAGGIVSVLLLTAGAWACGSVVRADFIGRPAGPGDE